MTCFAVLLLMRDYRLIQYTDILDVFVIELYSIYRPFKMHNVCTGHLV